MNPQSELEPRVPICELQHPLTPGSSPLKRKSQISVSHPHPGNAKKLKGPPSSIHTKHKRFWAPEGNVLLQIGKTRFKVHGSRLASESVWFTKLFKRVPAVETYTTGDGEDLDRPHIGDIRVREADGLPLYFLDSPGCDITLSDFEALLGALDDAISFYHNPPSFPAVASILRAAETFQVSRMSDFARKYIEKLFPSDYIGITWGTIGDAAAYTADAIVLGREYNIPSIMKRAFYEFVKRSSGPENDDAGIEKLSSEDLVCLARVQQMLASEWLRASVFPPLACAAVGRNRKCASHAAGLHYWDILLKDDVLHKYRFDPMGGLKMLMEADWKKVGYCEGCLVERRTKLRMVQYRIWTAMDTYFKTA